MSQPIEEVYVHCPQCKHRYKGWTRTPGFGDHFTKSYLDECRSAVCPECQHKVYFRNLKLKETLLSAFPSHIWGGLAEYEAKDE